MKILRLGDPHVKVSNIKESEALMQFVLFTATERKVDRIEILGDQFDNHSILRLEVLEFWQRWLWNLSDRAYSFDTYVLTGNHDISGDNTNNYSALQVFNDIEFVNIVSSPVVVGAIGYAPYIHDRKPINLLIKELKSSFPILPTRGPSMIMVCTLQMG